MLSSCRSVCEPFRSTTQARKKVHYNVPVESRICGALRTSKVHVMRSVLRILKGFHDMTSVESNRLLRIRIDSNRVSLPRSRFQGSRRTFLRLRGRLESSRLASIRKNFYLPAHLFAT